MKLISLLNAQQSVPDEQVFRTSSISAFIAFLVFFGFFLTVVGHYLWYSYHHSVNVFGYLGYLWFGFWFGLIAKLSWSMLSASRLPSNWLMKTTPDQLRIKFRSFQNYYYPETENVVLELYWSDIDWMRKTKETRTRAGSDGDVTSFFTYLDIKLNLSSDELNNIKQALAKERSLRPLQSDVGALRSELFQARKRKAEKHEIDELKQRIQQAKLIKHNNKRSGAKHHDYPVSLEDNAILRIRWNSIRPNIKKALTLFSDYTTVEEPIKIKSDSSKPLKDRELDDMILDRIAKGENLDAISLVKQHYGFSNTEAVQFVDELKQNQNES